MGQIHWSCAKWVANALFVGTTILMLSPTVAAKSITPWAVYLIANFIWMFDSHRNKDWAWTSLALFFCVLDVLLIGSRIFDWNTTVALGPLLATFEKLP